MWRGKVPRHNLSRKSMLPVDVIPDGSPSSTEENSGMIIQRIHRTVPEEQKYFFGEKISAKCVIEMKKLFREKILWVSILILFSLLSSCSTKKTTGPVQPATYLMRDYFPLNKRDWWRWKVVVNDSIPEYFQDGDVNLGEPFIDKNYNGIYEEGTDYFDFTMDLNENGKYDGPNDPWTPGVPYKDWNNNGEYDPPNGVWDEDESFVDLDGNGICSKAINLILDAMIGYHYPLDNLEYRSGSYRCTIDGEPGGAWACRDGFTNDSLGLRWHEHGDMSDWNDYLKDLTPITIARANTKIGDTISYVDTSSSNFTWISIFEGIEDVCVPAEAFQDCLKFKTIASGWMGNMEKYNGTSYQWYAKDVGLVKSEGPKVGESWQLESATIKGKSYP
jgi:hypothetical protein